MPDFGKGSLIQNENYGTCWGLSQGRKLCTLLVITFVSSLLAAQQPKHSKTDASGPSLAETLDWMKNALASSGTITTIVRNGNDGSISYSNRTSESLESSESCQVTFKDFTLIGSGGNSFTTTYTVNLGDIDPSSMKLTEKNVSNMGAQTASESGVRIDVETTNLAKTIAKTAEQELGGKQDQPHTFHVSSFRLFLSDKDVGARFEKALSHAIELCGGKKSAF